VRTVGLGDAPIDLAMLAETDVAYALPRHDGGYINTGRTPATLMQLPGAAGWNVAIHSFLDANGVDA
jgi:hypothetical protein